MYFYQNKNISIVNNSKPLFRQVIYYIMALMNVKKINKRYNINNDLSFIKILFVSVFALSI